MNFKHFLSILSVICMQTTLFAQLSGTKVIGSAPSDYTTFAAAVSALNSQGVNGHVIFNIKPGTYTEQISINHLNSTNVNRTVTFQAQNGDSTSVILQYPSSANTTNNYVVQLNGADYITFKNMTIRRTDTLNASQVIFITNGCRRNQFLNNIIEGNTKTGTSTFAALIGSDVTNYDSYNTFSNNILRYGHYGFNYPGMGQSTTDTGTVISNNKFINQSYRALSTSSQRNIVISGNEISSNSTNNDFVGIFVQYAVDTFRIISNKINIPAGGYGIRLPNSNPTSNQKGLVANNFISLGGTSGANGIYLETSKHVYIFYNSINIYSTHTTSGVCLNIGGSGTDYIYVKNNVLANTGGGYSYYVSSTVSSATALPVSDYNDLYTTGVYIGWWKSANQQTSLANWRSASGLDQHSVSTNPLFVSATDLHASANAINGAATPNTETVTITNDIDGHNRNVATPDIGADEFSLDNLGIKSIHLAPNGYCPGETFQVTVSIKNYGAFIYNGTIPVYYSIGAYPTVNQTTTYASLAPGDSLQYTFTNNESIPLSGTYTIKAGTAASPDINPANDTLSISLLIKDLPNADAGNDQTMCLGIGAYLTASGGDSYLWSVPPPNNTQSITVNPVNTTTYYVTVTSSVTGCSATDSIKVEVVSVPLPVAGFTFSAVELTVSFTNTTTGATSQYWEFGDGGYSTDTNPVHLYLLSGDYNVKLTAINVCGNNVFQQLLTVVGIQDYEQDENLSFFPNPASDILNIELKANYIRPDKIQIIDAKGHETYNIQYIITQGSIRLDVSGLPEGMYYAAIHTEEVIKLLKFLIVK